MDASLEILLSGIKGNIEKRTENSNKLADADPRHDLAENTITKSNALSRAYYRFSLVEKRCMEALISKLNPMRNDNIQEIELKVTDYAKTFSVSDKYAYRDLNKAVFGLMRRVISAEERDGKRKDRVEFTLMSKAKYMEDLGCIVCIFNPLIVPYLIGLRRHFSSYPLKIAVNFSSSYAWRFYELLVSWAQPKKKTGGLFAGWFTIEVAEMRHMFGVPESYTWGMFQKQVLNKAQSELAEKANIHLNITRIKTSRKITHLKFEFIENKQDNS